jgi:pimeloyl-ACP methyl ester carboxylesterase
VVQNGNAYLEGFSPAWSPLRDGLWQGSDARTRGSGGNNPARYPEFHAYLREHRPPVLVAWGERDPYFTVAGARAYLRDQPDARLHLLSTGHFALEEEHDAIAELILDFYDAEVLASLVT